MKKTRKILSILLALIMALSLCTVAFAEGDEPAEPEEPAVVYNWVPLSTSPEGLENGAYWLDLDSAKDAIVAEEVAYAIEQAEAESGEALTPEQITEITTAVTAGIEGQIASYKSAQFFFDPENFVVKKISPVLDGETGEPVLDEETGEPLTEESIETDMLVMISMFYGIDVLKQVGTEWVLVKPADAQLEDGDYYFDKDAAIAAFREGMTAYYLTMKPEEYTDEQWLAALADTIDEAAAGYEAEVLSYETLFANKIESDLFKWKMTVKVPVTEEVQVLDEETGEPVYDEYENPVYEDVPVLDEEGNPVLEEQTITYAYYYKLIYAFMDMMEIENPEQQMAMSLLPYEAISAGIKKYEKPAEPTTEPTTEKPTDKPSDKDEDGGYSNNAFMKFIQKIIDFFKNIFSKIFK